MPFEFPTKNERLNRVSSAVFSQIPGSPIAYWLSELKLRHFADQNAQLGKHFALREGLTTGDNDKYLREWHETSTAKFNSEKSPDTDRMATWVPHRKGGEYRKWYGNNEKVIMWKHEGAELKSSDRSVMRASTRYFEQALSWSRISSGSFSIRYYDNGQTFDSTAPSIFGDPKHLPQLSAFMNSPIVSSLLEALSPTLDYRLTNMGRLPFIKLKENQGAAIDSNAESIIGLSRSDWDAYETSWDFTTLPLLLPDHRGDRLADSYATLRTHWQSMTDEMRTLEEENNRIFIDAYGLQDELTPEVPLNEITLTCNPAYRYGIKNDAAANETRLRADTMAEFLSYAVGCMFGRYSLDAPGLILANQGETLADYLARIPQPQFMPDEDNVIPVLDADWFPDDITERFRLFLRTTFGEDHFRENLRYIEDALGKDIRKYFTKDFYADHVKRYKKRPIYWMFSSSKGTFNALIYMHRYRADTVSVVLNEYLREYRSKLEGYRAEQERLSDSPDASQSVKTKALKEIDRVGKVIDELSDWERDVIYPLATQKIEIDLDDGVKANYPLFGTALKKIPGLS
ncbi:BREX-1 system adenine-specific DNA-methyltransferase PglX [Tateyamaria pelophila]|uniref:BREX-1 system adenine-specific DNA-methyltransferase PglX n=1 Tax=Tateyamaria pelophila TaxID=328415 RepID=UPI001CBCE12F|nr:BREX-1 system adenine-specific DNA-methyltransferase PglX [Tateyamaria pelophila]